MSEAVILLILFPLAATIAPLVAKLPVFARRPRAARGLWMASVALLAGGLGALVWLYPTVAAGKAVVYTLGSWEIPLGIALKMDGLAWLSSLLVYLLSVSVGVFALSHREYGSEFYFFFALLVAGMEGVVLTTDVFNLFVSFEIVAIAAYVLIAYHRDARALVASFKYLILSSVGILFFLFGIFLVYRELGTLSLEEIAVYYRESSDPARLRVLRLALSSLVVGVAVRTAFLPFHTWLPEAHAFAPHPTSALLSGVLIKVSLLAMVRLIHTFDPQLFGQLLLWIGAVTAAVGVVWALSQRDAKMLLAYHSISQMGYVVAGMAVAGQAAGSATGILALSGSLYHAINHGLFKSLLFLAVGTAIHMTGERDLYRMPRLGRRAPLLALVFGVGALSIAGVPGFNGYASKYVISSVVDVGPASLLLWITGVGTAASFIKLSRVFWPGAERTRTEQSMEPNPETASAAERSGARLQRRRRVPVSALSVMVFIALLCIAAGVAPRMVTATLGQLLEGGMVAEAAAQAPGTAQAALGASESLKTPFTFAKLGETAVVLALGVGVYLLTQTRVGGRAAHRVKAMAPSLHTVLVLFLAGLAGFAAVAYFAAPS
jgi:multicomponent Na+:H+ antiporter subunit D